MSEPEKKTDQVIFRFPNGYERLAAKAKELGLSPNRLAKELCRLGLDNGWADAPPANTAPPSDELKVLLRKVAWCVIVALSPTIDEAGAEEFLRETFDV